MITDLHILQSNLCFGSIGPDQARRFGGHIQQRTYGFTGALTGPQFHHLAQQDQRDDNGCRLKINADVSSRIPEAFREDPWHKDRYDAEDIGRPNSHADQAEHIQVHCPKRDVTASKEGPAGP